MTATSPLRCSGGVVRIQARITSSTSTCSAPDADATDSASSFADSFASSRSVSGTMRASVSSSVPASSVHSISSDSSDRVDARGEPADDELLDLRRPLVEAVDTSVTPEALDGELVAEAIPAVDLDRVVRDALRHLRREELRDARLARVRLSLVFQIARAPHEKPRGLGVDDHVRDHLLHQLVPGDRLAERLALGRVRDRCVDRGLRRADGARGHGVAARVERGHRDLESLADLAEPCAVGHAHVIEDELARVRRAKTELPVDRLRSVRTLLAVDEERGDALVALARVGVREDKRELRHRPVGDPRLPSVEHPAFAVVLRGGLQARRVAPDRWLGEPEARDDLAFAEAGEPRALLLLGAPP